MRRRNYARSSLKRRQCLLEDPSHSKIGGIDSEKSLKGKYRTLYREKHGTQHRTSISPPPLPLPLLLCTCRSHSSNPRQKGETYKDIFRHTSSRWGTAFTRRARHLTRVEEGVLGHVARSWRRWGLLWWWRSDGESAALRGRRGAAVAERVVGGKGDGLAVGGRLPVCRAGQKGVGVSM